MEKKLKYIKIILISSIILAVPALLIRIIALLYTVDPNTGFFTANPILSIAYNIYMVCSAAFLLIFYKLKVMKKHKHHHHSHRHHSHHDKNEDNDDTVLSGSKAHYSSYESENRFQGVANKAVTCKGALTAFAQIFLGFTFLIASFFRVFPTQITNDNIILDLNTFISGFGLISALYFILSALKNTSKKNLSHFIFSFAPTFFFSLRLILEYREILKHINRNVYFCDMLYLILVIMFFINRMQVSLDYEPMYNPNAFICNSILLVFFGIAAKIPSIYYFFSQPSISGHGDAATAVLDVAIALFAFTKLVSILHKSKNANENKF